MFEFLESVLPSFATVEDATPKGALVPSAAPVALDAQRTTLAPEAPPPATDPAQPADPERVRATASSLFQKMDGLIQDEKGVLAELGKLSASELAAVKAQYRDQHDGRDLDRDVLGAMDRDGQKAEAQALLAGNDPHRRIAAAAAALKGATEDGLFGTGLTTDHQKIHETLASLSPDDMKALKAQMGDAELKKLVTDNESTNDKDLSLALIDGDAKKASAIQLDEAMHGGILTKISDTVAETVGVDKQKVRDAVSSTVSVASTVAMVIPGLQIAAIGMKVLGSDKADGKGVEGVLEKIKDPEKRKQIAAEYQKRTGERLDAALDHTFSGSEREIIGDLEKGEADKANAARLRQAGEKWTGTDKEQIFKVLEGAGDAKERARILAQYKKDTGKDFGAAMADDLGAGVTLDKVNALAKDGKVSPALALDYALNGSSVGGLFADKEALKGLLKDKSKAEIAALSAQYRARTGGSLEAEVADAASGRDALDLKLAMAGRPTTPGEMMAQAKERFEFERSGGDSLLGYGAMAVLGGPLALPLLAAGVSPSDISRLVTDTVSSSGKIADANERKLEAAYAAYQKNPNDPAAAAQVAHLAANSEETSKSYGVAKDKVADQAAMAGGLAVSAAATIATGGAASPLMAALAAGAGGATSIGIKAIMKGGSYSNHELATDVVMTAVQAGSAGVLGALAKGSQVAGAAALARAAGHGAIGGAASGLAGAAMAEQTWKGSGLEALGAIAEGGVLGAAGGAAQGVASAGVGQALQGLARTPGALAALAKNNPKLYGALAATLGGAVGGAAQTAVTPGAYESPEELLKTLGQNMGQSMIFSAAQGVGEAGHTTTVVEHDVATWRSPAGAEPAAARPPSVEVVEPRPLTGPATERMPIYPDAPKSAWAWGSVVPENPGFVPEGHGPASAPTELAPTRPSPAGPEATPGRAPSVDVVEPRTMTGPATEPMPLYPEVPKPEWAWGPVVPENPEMWPASAAPSASSSSEDAPTRAKVPAAPAPASDPATLARADLPKEQWAWGKVVPENPGLWPESATPSRASTEFAPTEDAPTRGKPTPAPAPAPAPTPEAEAPPTVKKVREAKAPAAAEPQPAAPKAAREPNPDVARAHGKEIARLLAEAQEFIEYPSDPIAKARAERNHAILSELGSVADPALAGAVLERMQDLELLTDGPQVDRHQELLKSVVRLEDPTLARDAFKVAGKELTPDKQARLNEALAGAATPEGAARLASVLRGLAGADGPVLHVVRPLEEVPVTPGLGDGLGEAMKGMPYGSEQVEVAKEVVDHYRQMLRDGIPLEPVTVMNGETLIDGHHRAVAQWLELGEVPYVKHVEQPGYQPRPIDWDSVMLMPTWEKDKGPLAFASAPEPAAAPAKGPMGGLAAEAPYVDGLIAAAPKTIDDTRAAEMAAAAREAGHDVEVSPSGDHLHIAGKGSFSVTAGVDPDAVPGQRIADPAPAPAPTAHELASPAAQTETPANRARAAMKLDMMMHTWGGRPMLSPDQGLFLYEYGSALGAADIVTHGPTAIVTVAGKEFLVRNTDDIDLDGVVPAMAGETTAKVKR